MGRALSNALRLPGLAGRGRQLRPAEPRRRLYYQFNWQTPTSYAGSCKTMKLDIGDGVTHQAPFKFTK
jgi:hypothetical protein